MDLDSLGRLISERRFAQGLTLADLAARARVGRSTLAALESGKLPELGFNKVARICAAAGILLETRPPLRELPRPRRPEFTKPVIQAMIEREDVDAWHGLVRAMRKDDRGLLAARVRQLVGTLDLKDPKVAAFTALLPPITRRAIYRRAERN